MPFAPHEIENKRFVVALRGYSTDEVDAFLRAVAADYRAALEQEAPRNGHQSVELVAEIDRVLSTTREEAEAEARRIVAAAKQEAADLRTAVEREAEAFYAEIERQATELQTVERRVRDQLHALERVVIEGKHSLSSLPLVYSPRTDA